MKKIVCLVLLSLCLLNSNVFASKEKELFDKGVRFLKENQYPEAVEAFSRLLEIDPENPDAYKNRGVAYMKMNEYDLAIDDFQRTQKIVPDLKGLYSNLGVAWYYKADYTRAIENYDKEIALSPYSHYAYFNRAICWAELKAYEKSLEDIARTLSLSPDFYLAHCLKGDLYVNLREPEKARKAYQKAVEVAPEQTYAKQRLAALGPEPEPEQQVAAERVEDREPAEVTARQVETKTANVAPTHKIAKAEPPAEPVKPGAEAVSPPTVAKVERNSGQKSGQNGYELQAGAFRNQPNASSLKRKLENKGYEVRILTLTRPSQITWYLVRTGQYAEKKAA
ncbi:MAG: tetratricopeptide repeat protein, partial [Desulfobacterales bacterium]|nr:tetratricopeptide repeat protein [Desulfobacterales bacterium]